MILGTSVKEFAKTWRLQRSFNWEFLLPDIDGYPGTEVSKYCQSVSFGQYEVTEVDTFRYGPFRTKYVGQLEIPKITATFLVPIPDSVGEYFRMWKGLMIGKTGFYKPKVSYAKDLNVYLYDRTGAVSNRYKFGGCFPETFPKFELSYGTEEVLKYEVVFSVDRLVSDVTGGALSSDIIANLIERGVPGAGLRRALGRAGGGDLPPEASITQA